MSNFLAIATVTSTLIEIVKAAAEAAVSASVAVSADRPQANGAPGRGVHVFLYQATPSAALRNADLPTRREDGSAFQRPCLALELSYLLTFHGNATEMEPQRMLGRVVSALHSRPVLSRERIQSTIDAAVLADPGHFLAASDLGQQVESVRLTPMSLPLDELSKLWSVFFQTPYQLSTAYQASVVLIESDIATTEALPVAERRVFALPFEPPVIERLSTDEGSEVIVAGSTLLISGRQFPRDNLRLLIGGAEATPGEVSDTRISVPLTPAALAPQAYRAGYATVQVVKLAPLGSGAPRPAFASNAAIFQLRPSIRGASSPRVENAVDHGAAGWTANVVMDVEPPARRGQRLEMLLNQTSATPNVYLFSLPPLAADAATVTFAVSGIGPGTYFCRLRVDGAESPLDPSPTSPTFGPTVAFL